MKVAIFGAGTMGSGIAQVFAAKGHTALMYASSVASAQRHKDKLAASLNKKVARGKMEQAAADDIMSRVLVEEFEAAADADLVIECVAENMAVKKELLGRLDALCKDETIFASNTSSLSITEIGAKLDRPLIGMHFFNPAPVMKLVEVIAGISTPRSLVEQVKAIAVELPTTVVREITWTEPGVKGDTSGKVLKPAKIATGFEVAVPLFVNQGDKIEIDTRTGEYRKRV